MSSRPRWSRRELLRIAGQLGGVIFAGWIVPKLSRSMGPRSRSLRQSTTVAEASPGATSVGTPVAAPEGLEVVREQRPTYLGAPRQGGDLRLMRPPPAADHLNPVSTRQDPQVTLSYLEPLLRPNPVTLEPEPWLAESWQWSDDYQTLTFALRADVAWHDGAPLTAMDVAFSLVVHRDDIDSASRHLFATMAAAEAASDTELRVTLAEPDGGWLFNAATQVVVPRAQYQDYWESKPEGERTLSGFDWESSLPLGCGPWRIDRWSESEITFMRNDTYWGRAASFDRMSVTCEEDADTRLAAWQAGTIDLLWPVAPSAVEALPEVPGRLYVADAASVMLAPFNFWNPLRIVPDFLLDSRVRQALSLAIDRDRYAKVVFGTFIRQRAAATVAQPWANDIQLTTPRQSLARAQTLLTEAGWFDLDGDGILDSPWGEPLVLTVIVQDDAEPAMLRVLESVQIDYSTIGILLTIEELTADAFRERWTLSRNFDLIALSYRLYPGFTDFDLYGSRWDIRRNAQGFNPGGYVNADVDAAIADQRANPDIVDQRQALTRLQRAADEDLFGLWFGFPRDLVLVRPDVLGFQPNKVWQTADTNLLWRSESPP